MMRSFVLLALTAGALAAPGVVTAQHRVEAAERSIPMPSTSMRPFPGAALVAVPSYESRLGLTSERSNRLRNGVIGAVVGGAIGFAVAEHLERRTQDAFGMPGWVVYAPVGAATGALIGSLFR